MKPVIIKDVDEAIQVGYSGKILGNTNSKFGESAEANFAKFKAEFPGKTVYNMPATGEDNIVNVDDLPPEELDRLSADVLITTKPGSLLVLKAADCIPLVFYVPGEQFLVLAHVGSPGAKLHLPRKIMASINFAPDKIHVYVGPHISQKSYRFPKENWDKKLDTSWDKYLSEQDGYVHINLLGYVLDELKACGIKAKDIKIENVDTAGDTNYFSHRRHRLSGEPDGRNCFAVHLL